MGTLTLLLLPIYPFFPNCLVLTEGASDQVYSPNQRFAM
jgi:hypothetical protein